MKVGDKVEHVLTKDWMLVIKIDENLGVLCRLKDYDFIWFEDFELREIK